MVSRWLNATFCIQLIYKSAKSKTEDSSSNKKLEHFLDTYLIL